MVNLYVLHLAKNNYRIGAIDTFISSLSFIYRFYQTQNFTEDKSVCDLKQFVAKVCPKKGNKKQPFGATEVRQIFDKLCEKSGPPSTWSKLQLRTFMLAVFQHKTFCRYSDVMQIKLSDILFDTEYFKIHIRQSKTDQKGEGSFVYLPKQPNSFLDPHMLLCLYVHGMNFDENDPDVYLFPPLH